VSFFLFLSFMETLTFMSENRSVGHRKLYYTEFDNTDIANEKDGPCSNVSETNVNMTNPH